MAAVSPILKNQLEANKSHEKIYRNLTKHANDVKPNLPKAKLIREGTLESAVSAVQDTFQDGKNFFKAAKTGKLNDNNLGRINDLGMKAGALLIATYLAAHAKTKTDAIMQFIGGTTFFASMALWPKLFINLPAKICHGFRIDHKYLSAQGDKKDLGLDNQFQPMDIFTDEEMLQMAKNAGIDPNDEFAKEKMQRKLQKTMLQNRTLWMATAGFATPLMTSLIGNAVEPKVRNTVIKHSVRNVENIMSNEENLTGYLKKSKPIVKNVDELDNLFKGMETSKLDDGFFKQLAELFNLNSVFEQFKDPDDIKPILSFKSEDMIAALKNAREENSYVDKENLIKAISEIKMFNLESILNSSKSTLGEETAARMLRRFGDKISLSEVKRFLTANQFSSNQIDGVLNSLKVDNSQFFTIMKTYNSEVIPSLRGRLKAYMNLLNPVIGSKSESAYTAEFTHAMKDLFKKLGIKDSELAKIQKATLAEQQEFLSAKMKEFVENNPNYLEILTGRTNQDFREILKDEAPIFKQEAFTNAINDFIDNKSNPESKLNLKAALTQIFGEEFYLVKEEEQFNNFAQHITKDNEIWKKEILDSYIESARYQDIIKSELFPNRNDLEEIVKQLTDKENIAKIGDVEGSIEPLTKALLGGEEGSQSLPNLLKNFAHNKRIDLNSTKLKPIIAANFEARLLAGDFGALTDQQIKVLRNIVYDGTISSRYNNGEVRNVGAYKDLIEKLFDKSKFDKEATFIPGIKDFVEKLKIVVSQDPEKMTTTKYFRAGSFSDLVKNFGTRLNENRAWKKIFIPMSIALTAVTLLVQPLFGKIDNEFPKKAKKEGINNGNK